MSSIKKLAGQTLWYGVPNIASRFLGYLLSIQLFRWYGPAVTADITQVYALIPFLNILFTYGLETAYFRFAQQTDEKRLFNTLHLSLIVSTILFSLALLWLAGPLSGYTALQDRPEYFRWMVYVLFFDTLATIPFARLRHQERPRKYALVKVLNVALYVALAYYWLLICPQRYAQNANDPFLLFFDPSMGIGYYIIANMAASALTLLLLLHEWKGFRLRFDTALWKEVMVYAFPLIIVGFGGMINEMLSRLVYSYVLHLPLVEEKLQLGIFGASYKVAVLITIFIQVFKMAAEPFFFKQMDSANAPATYARVTKFFVIACCLMWLLIVFNLNLIAQLAYGKNYDQYIAGVHIIPILAMGSVFLGVYYNLSVWYKVTNRTWTGAWITLSGAVITIALNLWWIPRYGYAGSAWATFICYLFMMIISYVLGQRHYPVPYAWKKLTAYVVIAALLYIAHRYIAARISHAWFTYGLAMVLFAAYLLLLARVERKEMKLLPVVGRFF